MRDQVLLIWFATTTLVAPAFAETVADRQGAVLQDRATMEKDPRWIYNDYQRGFAEARRTGKPLLVVLRCVPCLGCGGLDARVLLENSDLSPLLDKFVCARVITANDLDLSRFQFDFDLSFSTLIFNGDGTVYGRYGSWTHQKNPQEKATDGFRRTLEAALEVHRGYPANKASLDGKQPQPVLYKTPIEMPSLQGKYSRSPDWGGKVVQSCVHCHQIGDAQRTLYRERKEPIPPNLVYPFPAPETVGVELTLDQVARVKSVKDGSPAARAGLKTGDDLVSLAGQPLISFADVSWVLHQAPEKGSLAVAARRNGEPVSMTIELPEGWRDHSDIARRVGTWTMRAMALGGLFLEDLSDAERERRGLGKSGLALYAKHVGEYGEHAAAKKAGFLKEDVLVQVAGLANRHTESELIGSLLKQYRPGDTVKVTVLRGNERVELNLPMQ